MGALIHWEEWMGCGLEEKWGGGGGVGEITVIGM